MKKKSMLAALVMLNLLQGSIYAEAAGAITDEIYSFQCERIPSDNIINKIDESMENYDSISGAGWYHENGSVYAS